MPTGVTAAVLRLLKYGNVAQLGALANLAGKEEGFDDPVLVLEARRRMQKVLEKAYQASKGVAEEEALDGVYTLGLAYTQMQEWDECHASYRRAKEGLVRLLGEDHAKSIDATYQLVFHTTTWGDKRIGELRALWERAKVSLPDEAITCDIAAQLGRELWEGQYKEAKVLWLTALGRRRRVLGEEHKDTLTSLNNMGVLLEEGLKDYEGALDYYYKRVLMGKEKVLGKTHPDTLTTIINMANLYLNGTKELTKAEEMYRLALDGREKSLGRDHEDTKNCVRTLAVIF